MTAEATVRAASSQSTVVTRLRAAGDVSTGSAELAGQITSWEDAYHFSPARLGVLAPLRLRAGMRAVELGCGSGVLTRALGEAGLDVLGVAATDELAEAAGERCRDLPGVRVVTGTEVPPDGPWDLVLRCEHGSQADAGVLPTVADALAGGGVLALATENRLGLRYLLGGADREHGSSWAGLADFPSTAPATPTWSRNALAARLADAGLTAQRWLLVYPDHILPRVILDEAIFARPDAVELVEKLVRDPLLGALGRNDAAAPGRVLNRLAVSDGFGAAVAPSFLVLAAASEEALAEAAEPGLAWLTGAGRLAHWRRTRRLDERLRLHTVHKGSEGEHPWLRQHTADVEPLVGGRPLDAHILDALSRGDLDGTRALLERWRDSNLADARPLSEKDRRHPYLPGRPGVAVLPPDHLDIHPGNVIRTPGGDCVRVDREWLAGDGVDAELVLLRALLEFAKEIVAGNAPLPWRSTRTVRGVHTKLCQLIGLDGILDARWPELVDAESRLQSAVSGADASAVAAMIEADAENRTAEPAWLVPGGLAALRAAHEHASALRDERSALEGEVRARDNEIERLNRELDTAQRDNALARHEVGSLRWQLADKDNRIALAFAELAAAVREADGLRQAATDAARARVELGASAERVRRLSRRVEALERSAVVRFARRVVWPTNRALVGTRDLVLGRTGDAPDAVLGAVGSRLAPVGSLLGQRIRRSTRDRREIGLFYGVHAPEEPVAVGRGQVVDLDGWLAHAQLPIRDVWLTCDGAAHRVRLGYPRPDIAAMLRASDIRGAEGCGFRVRVVLRPVDAPTEYPLSLRVELADGTVLDRELPSLKVRPALPLEPVEVDWPAAGPRVAICLASYRPNADFLARQLDSLRAQTYVNWVCVICDDGSDAASVEAIRSQIAGDPRFSLVHQDSNAGFYRNFERVLALMPANADLVALSDQDDVWDPDKLAVLVERMADPGVSLVYSDMRLIDEDDRVLAPTFWRHRRNQWRDLDALLLLNTITGAASMVRADLVREQVLPFPPGTRSAFHDQWIAAVALAAGRVEFVSRALQSYRQHAGAVTGRRDDRLDAGLPTGLGWLRLRLGSRRVVSPTQDAELAVVAEYELRRVAQFATVLLSRAERLTSAERDRLAELSTVEDDVRPLLARAARAGRGRTETAGAERFLLAAALRWQALRRERLRMPMSPDVD